MLKDSTAIPEPAPVATDHATNQRPAPVNPLPPRSVVPTSQGPPPPGPPRNNPPPPASKLEEIQFLSQYDSRLFGFLRIHQSPSSDEGGQEHKEAEEERVYLTQVPTVLFYT